MYLVTYIISLLDGGRLLQDGDIAIDSVFLVLGDTFRDPHNVSDLLLLELNVGIKHAIVELLLESKFV